MRKTKIKLEADYLVVGSGAGGSVAALELAQAGKDVLILEEGRRVDRSELNASVGTLMRDLYRQGGVIPLHGTPPVAFAEGQVFGGGTVINGGLLWRTPAFVVKEWMARYPQLGTRWTDHFDAIEKHLQVHRRDRNQVPGNRDSLVMSQAAERLGWKVVDVPRALSGCQNLNRCATGCPSGAKKSMAETYLPHAMELGARVQTCVRVEQLKQQGGRLMRATGYLHEKGRRTEVEIKAKDFILSAGPIQTPLLLKRSGLSAEAGRHLSFHLNLKFLAVFDSELHASQGTIFTSQIQQYEETGLLMMSSNWQAPWVAATASHFGSGVVNHILGQAEKTGLYVAQIRAKSIASIHHIGFGQYFVKYRLDSSDFKMSLYACRKMAEVLFEAGAREIYLPLVGSQAIHSMDALEATLCRAKAKQFEFISVHAMGSCAMGAVTDFKGSLPGVSNLIVADASILPSNIGESPQGTIMALSHEVIQRHLEKQNSVRARFNGVQVTV